MATGGPDSWALDVRWDGTTWVDETPWLSADRDGALVELTVGGDTWEPTPGVLTGTFRDHVRHIPGNPLSPLWPNVRDGALVRFSVTKGANTWDRHQGELSTSAPVLRDGDVSSCEVQFESVDILGRLAGTKIRSMYVEVWRDVALAGNPVLIVAPETDSVAPREVPNLGSTQDTDSARIVMPAGRYGTASVVEPDGVLLGRAWQLEKTDSNAIGPVLEVNTRAAGGPTSIEILIRTADRIKAGKAERYIAQGLSGSGAELWSWRLVDVAGATDLVYYSAGSAPVTMYAGFAGVGDSEAGDDQWHGLWLRQVGATSAAVLLNLAGFASFPVDLRLTRRIVVGGNLAGRPAGGQTNCTTLQVGAVAVDYALTSSHLSIAYPDFTTSSFGATVNLANVADVGIVPAGGQGVPAVGLALTDGRDALDVLAEITRTSGDVVTAHQTFLRHLQWRGVDAVRGATPVVTLSVEGDAGPQVSRVRAVTPSRVTASYPGGEVIWDASDVLSETARVRVDETVEVVAATAVQALHIAQRVAAQPSGLRISEVTVDLSGAEQDVWSAMMALRVGDRVRLTIGQASIGGAVPPLVQHYGCTWVDLWVTGWTERYAEGLAEFVLRTVPADDPVEGTWGADLRGRWAATPGSMTVTGGTCVGTTGTGTIVVTITGSATEAPAFSTSAGDYPMQLDWNGELVTVTSAPSAASGSPRTQTLTVTSRGVAPSIARVHAAGETIDAALPLTWAP